ncbi:MAG: PaaI family thioesterase [Pseudomonadota bacterium]
MTLKMDVPALQGFLAETFPEVADDFTVLEAAEDRLRVALNTSERHLRPGGTVSGPTLFALVDVGMYLAILSHIGPVALAVTTNCAIDFMRKPPSGAQLVCTARLLKLGKALAVGDTLVHAEGVTGAVARASLTYSIPPAR